MSLVGLGLLEHDVSPMEVVQHTQHTIALVELEMVVVVEFRRRQERKVVATVGDGGDDEGQGKPHGDGGQVGAHY